MKHNNNIVTNTGKKKAVRTGALYLTAAVLTGSLYTPATVQAAANTGILAEPAQPSPQPARSFPAANQLLPKAQQTVFEDFCTDEPDGMSNDDLFKGYLDQLFYGAAPVTYSSEFGTSSQTPLNAKEQELYSALKEELTKRADGNEKSTKFNIAIAIKGKYTPVPNDSNADSAAFFAALKEVTDIRKVVHMLLADCPYELYWYNKTAGYSFSPSSSTDNTGAFTISSISFSFTAASEYAGKNENGETDLYTIDTGQVQRAQAAKEKAEEIVTQNASQRDYDKLRAYLTAICDLNTYNTEAANGPDRPSYTDPWQLVYVFDGDENTNVVCEGYAKAFAYLCELSHFNQNIRCYTVTGQMAGGTGAGGHMWNIVTMEDGKNYLVDVTNCDGSSVGSPDLLFLAGLPGSVEDKYTFTRDNANTVTFTYDSDTKELYPPEILTLADSNYVPDERADQAALTFEIQDKIYGDGSFELSAEGGSGTGKVSYEVPEGNGVLSITGNTASITGAGTVTVTATKAGDETYKSSTASAELTVAPKSLTPSITGSITKSYDGTVSAEGASENTLAIVLNGVLEEDKDRISASAEYAFEDAAAGTGKKVSASNIQLSGAAAGNYILSETAVSASAGTITEAKKEQEPLTVTLIPEKTYGDADFGLSVTGGSGKGAVSWSAPADNGIIAIDGSTVTVIGTGEVTITAVKAADDVYSAAEASCRLKVAKKTLTPSISGRVTKKYDGTTSIKGASSNTLAILLDGILEKDRENVTASAEYAFADAAAGTGKKVNASKITLSGSAAANYILSSTDASADTGTIERAGSGSSSGGSSSGSGSSGGSSSGSGSSGGSSSGSGSSSGGSSGSSSSGGSYYGGWPYYGTWPYGGSSGSSSSTGTGSTPGQNPSGQKPDTGTPSVSAGTRTETVKNPDGSTTTTAVTTDSTGKVTQTASTTVLQVNDTTTKITETVTTDAGTSVTETTTERKTDGTTVQTEVTTSAGQQTVTKEVTTKPDGSGKEVLKRTDTNTRGNQVAVTTTAKTDTSQKITGITEKSVITEAAGTSAVTVKKDGTGKILSATAAVSRVQTGTGRTVLTGDTISQITEAVGQKDVMITMTVKDAAGKNQYKVTASTRDLSAKNTLYIYQLKADGEYIMTDAKACRVSQKGNISVSMAAGRTYRLVSKAESEKISREILDTVAVKKNTAAIRTGKTVKVQMSSTLNMNNVKKITYKSAKKSVAAVSKDGKVTAKKAGTTIVTVKVTLKNGMTKTAAVKVKVK